MPVTLTVSIHFMFIGYNFVYFSSSCCFATYTALKKTISGIIFFRHIYSYRENYVVDEKKCIAGPKNFKGNSLISYLFTLKYHIQSIADHHILKDRILKVS